MGVFIFVDFHVHVCASTLVCICLGICTLLYVDVKGQVRISFLMLCSLILCLCVGVMYMYVNVCIFTLVWRLKKARTEHWVSSFITSFHTALVPLLPMNWKLSDLSRLWVSSTCLHSKSWGYSIHRYAKLFMPVIVNPHFCKWVLEFTLSSLKCLRSRHRK